MTRVAVIAASGYIGGELLRILLRHPSVELTMATSTRYSGEYVFKVHPNLRGVTEMKFSPHDMGKVAASSDLVFVALPHGESVKSVPALVGSGLRIVDLSADFRLRDPEKYKVWYGFEHPAPDLLDKFVLGIPELDGERLKGARLVSSPGCMAITSILALAPLLMDRSLGVDGNHIIVDSKIGSSGSGGRPSLSTHYSERYNVVRPYKPAGHRHSAEIEQFLSSVAGSEVKVSMSAHAVNIVRGILCSCHVFTEAQPRPIDLWRAYRSAYGGRHFIRLVREKQGPFRLPDPKLVIGSNFCDIGFELEARTGRVVALAATDNLVKGAAGNAVQCMNLMLGLDERTGLDQIPLHPL